MLVSKITKEYPAFNNVDDAIKYMHDTNFDGEVIVYDINTDRAYEKVRKIYDVIKEYNKGKELNNQILPTEPFGYRGIIGCLGVQCYSIALGTYERNKDKLALFYGDGEYYDIVLDISKSKEKISIYPSIKALSSLAIIGKMYTEYREE